MKKFCIAAGIITSMIFAPYVHAEDVSKAYSNVIVIKDGQTQDIRVNVLAEDGCVFAPIRPIFNLMNAKITWDGARKQIRSSAMGNIVLSIGSNFVMKGGSNGVADYVLEGYPRIYEGSTMVPLKFLQDALNIKVSYAEASNTLVVVTE